MLFAVEGGGFFSSSASGYSKGLALLLFGRNHEDQPMRVTPWNQYQLVENNPDTDLQLASLKNRLSRRCASFACFSRTSAGLDSPSPLKVGPTQQQGVFGDPLDVDKDEEQTTKLDGENNVGRSTLKSSLKKPLKRTSIPAEVASQHNTTSDDGSDIPGHTERRKVQWTDVCGSELAEIREFEPSETAGSDDEFGSGTDKTCSCVIM